MKSYLLASSSFDSSVKSASDLAYYKKDNFTKMV